MTDLPSRTLILCDVSDAPFGLLRFAPGVTTPLKGECIFDISPANEEQGRRTEVRWLYKRRYKRASEHKFAVDAAGVITVSQGSFKVLLEPDEEGRFRARPPAPCVTARWRDPSPAS